MSHSWRPELDDKVILLDRRRSIRRLPGLTIEETVEFEALDAQLPFDENGKIAWIFEGPPTHEREKRWLELYEKMVRNGWAPRAQKSDG